MVVLVVQEDEVFDMFEHKCDGCRYKGEHQEMGFVPFGVCLKETNLIKAEQNYKAECCPYIVDAYANGTAEELQNVFEDLTEKTKTEDFQKAVEALQRLANAIAEVLNPILDKAMQAFKKIADTVLHTYPNKKVLHLAMYHPKERVRKKNMRRIMRWIERGCKNE